jgi:hypothetical protein
MSVNEAARFQDDGALGILGMPRDIDRPFAFWGCVREFGERHRLDRQRAAAFGERQRGFGYRGSACG